MPENGFLAYVGEVQAYSLSEMGVRLSGGKARRVARQAYVRQYVDEPLEARGDLHCPHLDPVGEEAVNRIVRQQIKALGDDEMAVAS